jgi:hypothetical protein
MLNVVRLAIRDGQSGQAMSQIASCSVLAANSVHVLGRILTLMMERPASNDHSRLLPSDLFSSCLLIHSRYSSRFHANSSRNISFVSRRALSTSMSNVGNRLSASTAVFRILLRDSARHVAMLPTESSMGLASLIVVCKLGT